MLLLYIYRLLIALFSFAGMIINILVSVLPIVLLWKAFLLELAGRYEL